MLNPAVEPKLERLAMPEPTPGTIWVERTDNGFEFSYHAYFFSGKGGNRKKRGIAIGRRMWRNDWVCRWCGDELPMGKRADAKFCGEGCRKRAARWRRASLK